MIGLIATAESVEQAIELSVTGMDVSRIEEETFGLRLPVSFTRDEQREVVRRAHGMGKRALAAVNGIMHPEKTKLVPEYLTFLRETNVDKIILDDLGIVLTMQRDGLEIPCVYDGKTLVTSPRRTSFRSKRGAVRTVLAREVSFEEMVAMEENSAVPAEIFVYGVTCIHQSKRPLT